MPSRVAMKRYFTHYWMNRTCAEHEQTGGPLSHIASNLFCKRGISSGDVVYAVTVRRGELFLIGRLSVAKICGEAEAARFLRCHPSDLWPANDHIIAASATPMHFDFRVPLSVTKGLLFLGTYPSRPLRFESPGVLDRQTLRGVRELDPSSMRLLDELLPEDKPV